MIKLVFTYEHSQRHKTHSNSYVPGYVLQVGYSGTIASASFKFCEIHIYIYIYNIYIFNIYNIYISVYIYLYIYIYIYAVEHLWVSEK